MLTSISRKLAILAVLLLPAFCEVSAVVNPARDNLALIPCSTLVKVVLLLLYLNISRYVFRLHYLTILQLIL